MWSKEKRKDLALLVLRVGFGLSMAAFHGWGKIAGGVEKWTGLGKSMAMFGITFFPVFWGFMAAFAEFVCSIFLALGLGTRICAFLLAGTMIVASIKHMSLPPDNPASGIKGASHALEFLCVYIALMISGPGIFSFDHKFFNRSKR